jgi:chemotaxis-related protein WspD
MTDPQLQNSHDLAGAAARLLNRKPPAGYVEEWTTHVAGANRVAKTGVRSALIFRIGTDYFALPTPVLQEVAQKCAFHTVPHKHNRIVRGIVNVRGELLLCVSLGAVLGLADRPELAATERGVCAHVLVCSRDGSRVGLPVAEVCAIHRYHEEDVTRVPATVAKDGALSVSGVLRWNDKTVACLDETAVFAALGQYLS